MTHLVDETEVEELLKTNWSDVGSPECSGYAEHLIPELLQTLSLALAVVRAAQEIRKSFSVKTDDDLRIALDPFSQPRSDAGTQGEK